MAAFRNLKIIQKAVGTGINDDDLLFDRQRRVLILLQNFRQPLAAGKLRQRGLVEIRSELRECRQFAELRQIQVEVNRQPGAWL